MFWGLLGASYFIYTISVCCLVVISPRGTRGITFLLACDRFLLIYATTVDWVTLLKRLVRATRHYRLHDEHASTVLLYTNKHVCTRSASSLANHVHGIIAVMKVRATDIEVESVYILSLSDISRVIYHAYAYVYISTRKCTCTRSRLIAHVVNRSQAIKGPKTELL